MGQPYVYPDNDLSYAGNFLSMMYKMTEVKYEPTRGSSAPSTSSSSSTPTTSRTRRRARSATSARRRSTPTAPSRPGVAALYGPLHGGANEAVLKMLQRIESTDRIPDFLEGVKAGNERLMGFGHRVYKNYDPRAKVIRDALDDVYEATGKSPMLDIATELEKRALDDEYFTSRKLFPNVDFYSGLLYEAMGLPVEMFPVMFAIGRTSGWIAQWLELVGDKEQKIARPRQIYTGARGRDYLPVDQRG
jgi:citrate synthase